MACPHTAGTVALLAEAASDLLPVQALVNFIALIPKPTGGDRPIALATLIYALRTRIRQPYIRE